MEPSEGTASGPLAEDWQAEGRGCGMSYADEGSGRQVGRQAFKPDFKRGWLWTTSICYLFVY